MTREDLLEKVRNLTDEQFERVAPFLEADLESADDLVELLREIEEGRRSAQDEPLLDAGELYERVRQALSE